MIQYVKNLNAVGNYFRRPLYIDGIQWFRHTPNC